MGHPPGFRTLILRLPFVIVDVHQQGSSSQARAATQAGVPIILVSTSVRMLEKRARSASLCHFSGPLVRLPGGEVRSASRFKISRSHRSRNERKRQEATWHQERPRVPL
jgi:hypothetical protein